jgi:hypothetical protein
MIMKKLYNKRQISTLLSFLFFFSVLFGNSYEVYAQTGDSIVKCGLGATTSTACQIGGDKGIGSIVKGTLGLVIAIGLPLLFIFVAYRFVTAWFSLQQGNANAYKDALSKAGNAIVGFLLIVVLMGGGLYAVLSFFGVDPKFLQILKMFSVSDLFPHAYAYEQPGFLPRPTQATNLYDFILSALSLVMKFFIYPALVVIWVWTGFSFVLAQGAPEALTKAKKWLMWAFITTLVIVVLQGFLLALRATALKVISSSEKCVLISNRSEQIDNIACTTGVTRV